MVAVPSHGPWSCHTQVEDPVHNFCRQHGLRVFVMQTSMEQSIPLSHSFGAAGKLGAVNTHCLTDLVLQESLEQAVQSAADFMNAAAKVVLVVGSQVKTCKAQKQAIELADACQYPVAVMPRSKGMFPETHDR